MKIEDLVARLESNAVAASTPVQVDVPGLGVLYVRKRTVKEFEAMASISGANSDEKNEIGVFGPSIVRLLCNEDGTRFTASEEKLLGPLLSKQPEDVFHAIVEASDGNSRKVEATESGN